MVTKIITGSNADFNDPANWRPYGVPQSGDTAALLMATVVATGLLPSGIKIEFGQLYNYGRSSMLTLRDATIPTSTRVDETTLSGFYTLADASALSFAGTVVNNGTIDFSGETQTVSLPAGTSLTNNGTIDVDGSSPQFSAGGAGVSFVNNGLIRIVNTNTLNTQVVVLGTTVDGSGTITVSANAGVEFGGAVASGQRLQFTGGTNAGTSVRIDQASVFAGTISGFVAGDTLTLANVTATSSSYVSATAGSGTLQLFNGGSTPVTSLQLSGTYAASDFTLSQSGSTLSITTAVTDPATGSTASPTSTGVFRFFNTADGTHFYTAGLSERDNVLLNRTDLVQEINGFGAVTTASNATVSVYRFFDTVHGTHFFTASDSERDQVVATRSDLTYEPSASFLEHAAPQAGDVAVYRLFSTTDGTHLYTGSPAELSGLTAAGSAYRAEGISFYAPAGSYL
ncbi:MAG: hypothetical protein ACRYF2_00040 [Janthinobacterium lividum]